MAAPDGAGLEEELLPATEKGKHASFLGVAMVALRWSVWLPMCLIFGMHVALLILIPTLAESEPEPDTKPIDVTTFAVAILVLFGGPFLLLTVFSIIYLGVNKISPANKTKARGRACLQEQPMVTKSLLGIVSAAELLWIVFFLAVFVWMIANFMINDFKSAEVEELEPYESVWGVKLKLTGLRLSFIGIVCLNLLFLPVARGSVVLRAVGIPFEHATKYHVWLGHFTLTVFTLHGLFYMIAWYSEGHLIEMILEWRPHFFANLPGVIALSVGIVMWVTSIGWVRKSYNFELFFYTHQMYIVFVLFMALHVGDFLFNTAFAGIFLFTFDRFLRFCQSRRCTDLLSAKLLPCGAYELAIAKPRGMKYHALSFIFLNVPGISALQWHPFSVSSSPFDGDDKLKVLIKPLGAWTHQLQDEVIAAVKPGPCLFAIKAAVEGPYGHEKDYFLHYETLFLVAGGIGVSPFVAILRDLLHRYQRNQPNLPSDVTLIWAVQKAEELQLLDLVPASAICPDYNQKFHLHIHAFVTRESESQTLEPSPNPRLPETTDSHHFSQPRILSSLTNVEAARRPMSVLVGTGSNLWISGSLLASLFGYVLFTLLVTVYVYEPQEMKGGTLTTRPRWLRRETPAFGTGVPLWAKGLFNFVNVVLGVVVFGGAVMALWSYLGSEGGSKAEVDEAGAQRVLDSDDDVDGTMVANESGDRLVLPSNTQFGHRPNLRELFEGCAKRQRLGTNVGVLVSGSESLQTSVAETCRRFNTKAVDRTLHDLCNDERAFGGLTVVFGGDCRQILPVIVKGSRAQIVAASLRRSMLWPRMRILKLQQNMRLTKTSLENQNFANWLLEVGIGRIATDPNGCIPFPEEMVIGQGMVSLIQEIYGGIHNISSLNDEYFKGRTILSTRNEVVDNINKEVLQIFTGVAQTFLSADVAVLEVGADNHNMYPTEYLNSLELPGLSPSKLELKVGCPIMLLRNIAPKCGLCNGSRLIVTRLNNRVIEAQILTGSHAGEMTFIPRITLQPTTAEIPFKFSR